MSLEIHPLHPLFAAELRGVDAAQPLAPETVAELWRAIERYAVLVLPGQQLDDDRQIAFARHFGEIQGPRAYVAARERGLRPEIADISNLNERNAIRESEDPRRMDTLGNRLWHTDGSFRRVPSALSMLYARTVPSRGGETELADLRAAYDALDDETKARIEDLVAEHDFFHSRAQLGFAGYSAGDRAEVPPVPQRLVRTVPGSGGPGSGRKTLYLAAHAHRILGMPVPDGRLLLRDLIEHATQREFVYRHKWRVGDLLIWDNRCTMHRGRSWDEREIRDMHRVSTRDLASTLEQVA